MIKRKTRELQERLSAYVVLPFDNAMAWEWAKIMAVKGHPMAVGDAWIAAAALRHGVPLVTHNPRHFSHLRDLEIITEAQS